MKKKPTITIPSGKWIQGRFSIPLFKGSGKPDNKVLLITGGDSLIAEKL
jgi:hypothetical protein